MVVLPTTTNYLSTVTKALVAMASYVTTRIEPLKAVRTGVDLVVTGLRPRTNWRCDKR